MCLLDSSSTDQAFSPSHRVSCCGHIGCDLTLLDSVSPMSHGVAMFEKTTEGLVKLPILFPKRPSCDSLRRLVIKGCSLHGNVTRIIQREFQDGAGRVSTRQVKDLFDFDFGSHGSHESGFPILTTVTDFGKIHGVCEQQFWNACCLARLDTLKRIRVSVRREF